MEITAIAKLLFGIITALGAMAAYKLNSVKSKQTQAELIKQFESALEGNHKYSTCELFALIYEINMDYKDILELIKRDDLNKVLYYIKKSSGMVTYKDGKIKYNTLYKKPWFRKIDKVISNILIYGAGCINVVLILMMPFAKGILVFFTLALLIAAFTFFLFQFRTILHDNNIREMIEIESKESDSIDIIV